MKPILIVMSLLGCLIISACNNASESTETKDSTNIQSVPDNTRNIDTGTVGDTSSYERMKQKTNDSPRVH